MAQCKMLNVQKIFLGGTPRKIIYCKESRLLLVMRTRLNDDGSSDICCVDPIKGSFRSLHKFNDRDVPKCMQLMSVGHAQLLVVGTGKSGQRAIMSSGEAERFV